jgi:hypothetical protein
MLIIRIILKEDHHEKGYDNSDALFVCGLRLGRKRQA